MTATEERPGDAHEGTCCLRVLLVKHSSSGQGPLSRAVRRSGQFEVVGEAADSDEAVLMASAARPDLMLLEVGSSTAPVSLTLRPILQRVPTAKIVVLGAEDREEQALEALQAGAVGFLGEELDTPALVRTLSGVRAGEAAISRRVATCLLDLARAHPERRMGMRPVKSKLTAREWEVLDLLSAGLSASAIARDLGLTPGTVRSHLRNASHKRIRDEH
jgi:DNA-binding NarL/FixJ family response regulator